MKKLLSKPSEIQPNEVAGKFERFWLAENPFPSEPVVNKDSEDKRINGNIYEIEIRRKEFDQVEECFLKQPLSNPNHLRLGYIVDTSYIGRGNGKSAFLINLQNMINREYCIDISNGVNKSFALYMAPEPGGRSKAFSTFIDILFKSILTSNAIKTSLATLRLEALRQLYPSQIDAIINDTDEDQLIDSLNSMAWFQEHAFDIHDLGEMILKNRYLQGLSPDFPLYEGRASLLRPIVTQASFERHYLDNLKKGGERLSFVFNDLIRLFQAASFNGAFVLVDDFERIPDFQSARQKKDFALELRSCLFDGLYLNAKIGFYNFLLVFHAGVPRLISDAWAESGMENRAPIFPQTTSKHVIPFEKLSKDHAVLLLRKYLSEYRIGGAGVDALFPFTEGAVSRIGEISEYNAAKILKMAYDLLDKASETNSQVTIDEAFVNDNRGIQGDSSAKAIATIDDAQSVDLLKKAEVSE